MNISLTGMVRKKLGVGKWKKIEVLTIQKVAKTGNIGKKSPVAGNGTVYKTNLVRTKSLSDHGPDQIWLCKRYLSVPKIWSGPKRDLLMCKDHGPIEFGPVPNLDM